ncbi:hypothetical protein OAV88_03195 [bacterium]|nr:hypothetical protein [bacterium]
MFILFLFTKYPLSLSLFAVAAVDDDGWLGMYNVRGCLANVCVCICGARFCTISQFSLSLSLFAIDDDDGWLGMYNVREAVYNVREAWQIIRVCV